MKDTSTRTKVALIDSAISSTTSVKKQGLNRDTPEEELVNSLTHGAAAVFSVIALILMYYRVDPNNPAQMLSVTMYGGSMIAVFTFSTLLHTYYNHTFTRIFLILDHAAIYWLIAGTYTPLCLIAFKDSGGYSIFYLLWGLAVAGTIFKIFAEDRFQWLSLTIYLSMGWYGLFMLPGITEVMGKGFDNMIFGGILYTVGVPFYIWKKLKFSHAIWHMFVFGGAMSIFYSIYKYIL